MDNMDFEDIINLTTDENNSGERIDKFLSDMLSSYSRSYVQKLISDSLVLVDNKNIKSNYKLKAGDAITIYIPVPRELEVTPENIPLDIIYEDDDIIVINKPKGMVVHPSAGHYTGTLVNALMYHCKDHLSAINGILRPGIVHRIDMDTTGVIVACKNDAAHISISEQLKEHSITRYYYAICYNPFKVTEGTVDAPIGRHPADRKKRAINFKNGKPAVTHYKVLENFSKYAYIQCQLETGRTHQIRVHMAHIGHPVTGDSVYGRKTNPFGLTGQCLFARYIGFRHPVTGEFMEFSGELPDFFINTLQKLRRSK